MCFCGYCTNLFFSGLFTALIELHLRLYPPEPSAYGEVTIRFRSARNNIDRVFFVCKDEKHIMLKTETDNYFDYYSYSVQLDNEKLTCRSPP